MTIKINGKLQSLDREMTLLGLIEEKGLDKEKIVIERNFEIVDKEKLAGISLENNDTIEIVAFVGGG